MTLNSDQLPAMPIIISAVRLIKGTNCSIVCNISQTSQRVDVLLDLPFTLSPFTVDLSCFITSRVSLWLFDHHIHLIAHRLETSTKLEFLQILSIVDLEKQRRWKSFEEHNGTEMSVRRYLRESRPEYVFQVLTPW